MSVAACAALVRRGDPDRFAAVMTAPAHRRAGLFTLYAFNLETARAPWVTREPMIAEMRLQWWRDVIAGGAGLAHEVAGPLHDLIGAAGLPRAVLDRMVAARVRDVYRDPFADRAGFDLYLEETAAGVMWLAALICGAGPQAETAVRSYGWAMGLAGYLRAVPALEARGRRPLLDGQEAAVRALAARGLKKIATARGARHEVGQASPALLAGWQAEGLLRKVLRDPGIVARGEMGLSEFSRRGRLFWQAFSGRW